MIEHGFVLLPSIDTDVVNRLKVDVFGTFGRKMKSVSYRYNRFMNKSNLNTPHLRHSIPLEASPAVVDAVASVVGQNREFYRNILGSDAWLVELSAIIALPGAREQRLHTDIPWAERPGLFTTFVALQSVTAEMGPTHVFPGTHTAAAHRDCVRISQVNRDMGLDGSVEESTVVYDGFGNVTTPHPVTPLPEPELLIAPAGGSYVIDTRVAHFGGSNRSEYPRALLCFGFQSVREGDRSGPEPIEGFTYHLDPEVHRQRLKLVDFIAMQDAKGRVAMS